MKTAAWLAACGIVAVLGSYQTGCAAQKPEEQVKGIALEINQAFVRNDLEGVAKYVADDITWFSHTNTERQDGREVFINSLKRTIATKQTIKWQERDIRVQVFGDVAIVSFIYEHQARIGDRTSDRLSRATYGFARRGGRWWLVHDHSSSPLPTS